MPFVITMLLLFVGLSVYGLYASVAGFFIAGAVGALAVFYNFTGSNLVIKWMAYWAILLSLVYAIYVASQTFFVGV